MKLSLLKNSEKFLWTNHSQQKMRFYRLSESRVKRVIRYPARVESGIAPDTIACMQRNDSGKRKEEIWVMWQQKTVNSKQLTVGRKSGDKYDKTCPERSRRIIISAWRYPGVSPVGEAIPIPEDVLTDLKEFIRDKDSLTNH